MKTVVDISKYINADAPELVLFGKSYTVKNDKKTVLALTALQQKNQENPSDDSDEKILKLLIGDSSKEIIDTLNDTPNYTENLQAVMLNVMALATGKTYEEMLDRFQKATE